MAEDNADEIKKTSAEISALIEKLNTLRKAAKPIPVSNYVFKNTFGQDVTLSDLFVGKEVLFMVHNMGQACRYCTVWADGLNGFVSHLENNFAFVLASKDDFETQRKFANSRNWRFRTVSHKDSPYADEMKAGGPEIVCYVKVGNEIFMKNRTPFGPGDLYCPLWHIIPLAGIDETTVVPQYNYWKPPLPEQMEDGGQNYK